MDYAARPCTYVAGRASRFCYYFEPERAACLKHKVVCGCRVQPQTGIRDRAARRRLGGLFTMQRDGGGGGGGVKWDRKGYATLRRIGIPCEPFPHLAGSCENNSAAFTRFPARITVVWVSCRVQAGGRRWARRLGRSVQLNVFSFFGFVCRSASVLELLSKEKCCLFECAN